MSDVWLNFIHSCAPFLEAGIPPVILVGTHVDKISQINRYEICERYFSEIRTYLSDKPTRFHLVDEDFAIDNTVVDSRLVDLKKKIVDVASQQSYWGEEMPTRWIILEQELMKLKAAGVKLITRSILEDLNQAGAVQIATEELDLFLRFQHNIGTILYFSIEPLKDKIVLDPQWMIDALKSLITAEIFVLRNVPAVADKWLVFKKSGILSPELIDAIWTKKDNPDFHDNKDHILLLMEKLNIIARPRSYGEDGKIKEETFYLAPCMLHQATPKEIITPELSPQMERTSAICFMCVGKFLPPPVFHRLIGACLTQWPIAKQESENHIFCGCCVFDLDLHHRLTVYLRGYVIFAHVTRMKVTGMSLSSELCIKAKNFIFENLSNIIENVGQSMEFELHIQCPNSDANSLQSLIAVSLLQQNEQVPCHSHKTSHILESKDLLKFWFEESQGTDERNTGVCSAVEALGSKERKQTVISYTSTQRELGVQTIEPCEQKDPGTLALTPLDECQVSSQERALPPGKKYHVFFSYCSLDIQFVKETVERLEKDHGFVCCEYDRDNTPGTPLLNFAEEAIRTAFKTVVVMTEDAFQSGFVLHEIDMAIIQGFNEKRKCVVPVLLKDCEIPYRLSILNYVDARDTSRRDTWWPKLLMELGT
ncbi:hypothetical protein CHS0354_011693 [Potamilus streckersoni]|uniref:TIR domain-containing protein n=1 Tax=Potamilus streckersoni TaxID=2493646 RepID=A0AAE0RRE2_9BIVA|nr:hypothetical protein CHS0354_011693 [Potamilus streckersoni]